MDAHRWLERGSHRIHPLAGADDVGELKIVLGGLRSLALHEFSTKLKSSTSVENRMKFWTDVKHVPEWLTDERFDLEGATGRNKEAKLKRVAEALTKLARLCIWREVRCTFCLCPGLFLGNFCAISGVLLLVQNGPGGFGHTMTIKIGLVGGGNISETHARAVMASSGLELVAIQGTNSHRVAELSRQYGGKPYQEFESFLTHQPMDLIIIGSPSGLHATQGIAAAHRGLHILTEKPIDVSLERADQLIAAVKRAGLKLGVIFQDRAKPAICQLKQWLQDGVLGRQLSVDARVKWYRPPEYYSNSKWRGTLALDGGGALINQAIHTLDLMLWLFGDVSRVQAHKATMLHAIEAEDTAVALIEFSSGTIATLQATTAAYPGYPRRLEITGTEGTIVLEHDRIVSVDLRKVSEQLKVDAAGDSNQSASSAAVTDFRGHQTVIRDFVEAIQQNRQPLCNGEEGRRSLALVQLIYSAAKVHCDRPASE